GRNLGPATAFGGGGGRRGSRRPGICAAASRRPQTVLPRRQFSRKGFGLAPEGRAGRWCAPDGGVLPAAELMPNVQPLRKIHRDFAVIARSRGSGRYSGACAESIATALASRA